MTKVDFYTGVEDKLITACKLCHKVVGSGKRVHLYSPDEATTLALDALLWSYPNTAFLPHCRSDEKDAGEMPVVLAHPQKNSTLGKGSEPEENSARDENFVYIETFPHNEVLISLHSTCLPFFSRFERVLEIVGLDAADTHTGRQRFGFYRDRGYEIRHFDLRSEDIHPGPKYNNRKNSS